MQLSIVNLLIYREMQLSIVYPVIYSVRARAWISPPTCDAECVINFGYPNQISKLLIVRLGLCCTEGFNNWYASRVNSYKK